MCLFGLIWAITIAQMQAGAVGILLSGATLMGAPRDAATGFQIVYFADV